MHFLSVKQNSFLINQFRQILSILFLAIVCGTTTANAIELYAWKSSKNESSVIIAVRENESPSQAVDRYFAALASDPELRNLDFQKPASELLVSRFKKIHFLENEARNLVITNSPNDFSGRIEGLLNGLSSSGVEPYLLPYALDAGLSKNDSFELVEKLNRAFPSFTAVGGADVDQRIFGRKNIKSVNTNFRRDQFEATLLKAKLNLISAEQNLNSPQKQHRIMGICRGMQFISGLLGYEIGQDIPSEVESSISHRKSSGPDYHLEHQELTHKIQILPTTSRFFDSLIASSEILVNSYHHQYVKFRPNGPLELAAVSIDGITEALVSPDGRILLFQFHPELMLTRGSQEAKRLGQLILSKAAQTLAPQVRPKSCSALFRTR